MIFKKASYDPFKDKIQNWILSNVLKKNKKVNSQNFMQMNS